MKNSELLFRNLTEVLQKLTVIVLLLAASTMAYGQIVAVDKADYLPGESVVITGSGWLPGETVSLLIEHTVFTDHPDDQLLAVVSSDGMFYNDEFVVQEWDLGETFLLTATGQSSGSVATMTFTDAEGSISKVYQHWADGDATTGSSADWNNNILNDNKSDYFEGEVIPHVFVYTASNNTPLENGKTYSFNIVYNFYQQNTNAGGFAYITTYDISRDPGLLGANNTNTPPAQDPYQNAGDGMQGMFYTVDAEITNVSGVTYTGSGTKDGVVTVTFKYTGITTSSGFAEIYFGLYIAEPGQVADQGAGATTGASSWTGGSLQTTITVGGSGGYSIQLSPSAIIRGEISGHKFNDQNNNGTWDTGEPALAGWTIELYDENGQVLETTTTNANGYYFFSVTPDADKSDATNDPYFVREVEDQVNWTRTKPVAGYYGPLIISAGSDGKTSYTNLDFGNYYCLPPSLNNASLSECADSPGGTTATFDLTSASTGADPNTMVVTYSIGGNVISTPKSYSGSDGAQVKVTAYKKGDDPSCKDEATITLNVDPVPDLSAASLTECADLPGGTTATFDLTKASTGVVTSTMAVTYSDGSGQISDPTSYPASDGAKVTVTAYYTASDASCTDQAEITLNVDEVPDLSAASLTECADLPGGTTATFDLTKVSTGVVTSTMAVTYSDGSGEISDPTSYPASDGAKVTVTAYYIASDESCTDQAEITLNVDPVPDLTPATAEFCLADLPEIFDPTLYNDDILDNPQVVADFEFDWSSSSLNLPEDMDTPGVTEFTVTVTNKTTKCSNTSKLTVTIYPQPVITKESVTELQWVGANHGAIDISVAGGTPPYDYAWTALDGGPIPTGQDNNQDLTGLRVGVYQVIVTDANSCADTLVVLLDEPLSANLELDPVPINCAYLQNDQVVYSSDGAVSATISGNVSSYVTYSWTGPGGFTANTKDISGLDTPGEYILNVKYYNDEAKTDLAFQLNNLAEVEAFTKAEALWVSASASVDCSNGPDGLPAGKVSVTGNGYETLQLWNAGADMAVGGGDDSQVGSDVSVTTSYDFTSLPAGYYYVIAKSSSYTGTADYCEVTGNVVQIDPCYWFNIVKLTQGVVNPDKSWSFVVYNGPDGFGSTALASDNTFGDQDGILDFGFIALDPDNTYTICEENMASGWSAIWITDINGTQTVLPTYNPNTDDVPAQDLGNRCFDIGNGTSYPLYPNDVFTINVNNTYPGGMAKTPGYWKNWNTCTGGGQAASAEANGGWSEGYWLLDDVLNNPGISIGTLTLGAGDCETAIKILDQRDINNYKKKASDAAYTLAMHLMAFKLNQVAGAYHCQYAIDAAMEADALLTSLNYNGAGDYLKSSRDERYSIALELAGILDDYNNNLFSDSDCQGTPPEVPQPESDLTCTAETTVDNIAFKSSNGEVTINVFDGTAPYQVCMNGICKSVASSGGTAVFTGLAAGTYTFTVSDAGANTSTCITTVNQQRKSSKSGIVDDSDARVEGFELEVYPNPFSNKVIFEFTSPADSRAVLEIHSITGQKIVSLLDRQVYQGVSTRVEYEPAGIAPGILIYQLRLDGNIRTGRLIYK